MDAAAIRQALTTLQEAEFSPGVLTSTEDQLASIIQSLLAAAATDPRSGFGLEARFDHFDREWIRALPGFLREKLRNWGFGARAREVLPTGIEPLPAGARLAVLGDWGAGNEPAQALAKIVEADPDRFDALIHLGDVYYTGAPDEVADNFIAYWPTRTDAISRAIPGNHEGYSGGKGFYEGTLRPFAQPSPLFAFGNDHWLLLGLDTAFGDDGWLDEQVRWAQGVLVDRPTTKLGPFTHHPPFGKDGDKSDVAKQLKPLLERGVAAWWWGHEHADQVYAPDPTWGFRGRCVGAGAVPEATRAQPQNGQPHEFWIDVAAVGSAGPSIRLAGDNPLLGDEGGRFAPNAMHYLQFDGADLTETAIAATGTVLPRHGDLA